MTYQESLTPYRRGPEDVRWLKERLGYMSCHTAVDLPLVRYKYGQSEAERSKPIHLEHTLMFKGRPIEQILEISYSKKAPSPSIYDTMMAINWLLQEQGFNNNILEIDSINRISKMTGGNRNTILSDLERLTGVHISGRKLAFDLGTGDYWDIDIVPFPLFARKKRVGINLPRRVIFQINDFWMAYIQNNILHLPQTYHDYFALKSVLAKLLFTRLMKVFYKIENPRADMMRLGRWLLLENANIHSMKQTFERACQELEKIHFLRSYKIKESKTKEGYTIYFRAHGKSLEDLKWLTPPTKALYFGSLDCSS